MSLEQSPEYQYLQELEAKAGYEDAYYNEDTQNTQEEVDYTSRWTPGESQFVAPNEESMDRERLGTSGEENQGFVSRGRMPDRHVPPRDFPHPQPHDPKLGDSPVYGHPYPAQSPSYYAQPANDLAVPEYPMPSPGTMKSFYPDIRAAVDRSTYDDFQLPSAYHRREPSSSSTSSRSGGGTNQQIHNDEQFEGMEDSLPSWCNERRDISGQSSDGENSLIEFGTVGVVTETFWPKPGDILILANERKGCRWPAFDGHLEIYVDDEYFSKSSVALQWNYNFSDGDIMLRFGDFDRHWRWRANDHIHVFLRDNDVFYLVARQAAQELHPLDFRFVDPRQRPVHAIQYHMQPRVGDLILRKGTDDSYLWNTSWWHPGGDSHFLLKHLKISYPQGPDPKYRWTCHWNKRGFKFQPEDVLLRVGYEGAEDNVHCYCVCELYFRTVDGLWTFQGRDDYSFGPPSRT